MKLLRHLERQGHALALCKLRLDLQQDGGARRTAVIFELSVGSESLGSVAIPAEEIGLPLGFSEAKSREQSEAGYRLPESLFDFARTALPPAQPLYLAFETPSGYLPGVPWEKLATARLERPVLRLGAAPVQPVRSERTLDIAYCCSLPQGQSKSPRDAVQEFIQQLPQDLPRRARLHVFGDADLFPMLEAQVKALSLSGAVRVYPPEEAQRYVGPRASGTEMVEASELENPWLLWMRDSLKHLSLDGVHFVTMGYLGRTRPGIRFANSPVHDYDYAWSRVVGARQLAMFLEQVGAWAVGFSSPPENTSVLGLRMLFDEITRMVSGPVAIHDIASDVDADVLRKLYWYIFAPEQAALPSSPALALATHPTWTGAVNRQANERLDWLVNEYTLRNRVSSLTGEEETPAWVSAQQRSLEKTIADIAAEPESESDRAHDAGVREALKFTSELIAKYAGQEQESGGSGGAQGGTAP